jgi:hypothetical protein
VCEPDDGSSAADTDPRPDVVEAVVAFLDDLLDGDGDVDDDLDVADQPPP